LRTREHDGIAGTPFDQSRFTTPTNRISQQCFAQDQSFKPCISNGTPPSDYSVMTNPQQEAHLRELQLDMGITEFKNRLPGQITVPASLEARPAPENFITGLRARGWPANLVA
jgi:hypothetical protein